jgi:hypothetical protein
MRARNAHALEGCPFKGFERTMESSGGMLAYAKTFLT